MLACVVLGYRAARRRDISRHRAWMTRAYALALGASTQAFTVGLGEALFGSGVVRTDLTLSAGWAINLAVGEAVLLRQRPSGIPRQRRVTASLAGGAPVGEPARHARAVR